MPDSRPMSALRYGRFDDPPASSEASTPRSRRRGSTVHRGPAESRRHDNEVGFGSPGPPLRRAPPLSDLSRSRRRPRSPEYLDHTDAWSFRAKRRKLDVDALGPACEAIKYGEHGQVKAGKLKMYLVSCDGGEQKGHGCSSTGPENILQHDRSVYCSQREMCNIVLRHRDDTPFCLEKLHIVAPEHGRNFLSPVREGIVYVAMGFEDIEKYIEPRPRNARRHDWSPRYRQNRVARLSERMTLPDALRDPLISAAVDADPAWQDPSRYDDRSSGPGWQDPSQYDDRYPRPDWQNPPHYHDRYAREDADLEDGMQNDLSYGIGESLHGHIADADDTHRELSRYYDGTHPLATLMDEELEPEAANAPWPEDLSSNNIAQRASTADYMSHLDATLAQFRPREPPQCDHNSEDRAYRTAVEENMGKLFYEDGWKDKTVTRARFRIRQGKHKVTIRFNPALSGRFILLKMWSSLDAYSVDIQSVIAKGYGGCRFFPAVDLR